MSEVELAATLKCTRLQACEKASVCKSYAVVQPNDTSLRLVIRCTQS